MRNVFDKTASPGSDNPATNDQEEVRMTSLVLERERLKISPRTARRCSPPSRRRDAAPLDAIRAYMAEAGIDAALFTSYHCINCHYSDFLYCYFGPSLRPRHDPRRSTSISAGIDGGQPARSAPSAATSPTPTGRRTTTSTPSAL